MQRRARDDWVAGMAYETRDAAERKSAGPAERQEARAFLHSLVSENHDALIRYIRRRIGDADEADDIAQDLYCRIARQPHASIKQPRAYLFQAARNFIVNRNQERRRNGADFHFSVDAVSEAEMASETPSPERVAQSRQELAVVEAAIAELSPKCRSAFLLVRFEERSYKDAAAELGLSVKSIEYYMREALLHIRARADASARDAERRQAAE
jgi:RNA polymerase sigma-70 factor (ECF subfamily)